MALKRRLMTQCIGAVAVAPLVLLTAPSSASIGQHWGPEISDAQASKIALTQTGGGSIVSASRPLEGGYLIYRIVVATPAHGLRQIEIGAMSGKVLSMRNSTAEKHQ